MASYELLVVGTNGKPTRKVSSSSTVDFLSLKIGAAAMEIKQTGEGVSGVFDFSARKLANVSPATGAGEVVEFGQFGTALSGKSDTGHGHAISDVTGLQTALDNKVDDSEKGAANGVATLDGGGKVPVSQLPNSVMEYKGSWDASSNTPSLSNVSGNAGDVYITTVSGTVDFGAGAITFAQGDWVMYSGSAWEKSVNSNAVASVNGKTGVVVLTTDDVSEGSTNKYFSDSAALAAAVQSGAITSGVTKAPTHDAVFSALSGKSDTGHNHDGVYAPVVHNHVIADVSGLSTALSGKQDVLTAGNGIAISGVTISADHTTSLVNDNAGAITLGQIAFVKANGNVDLAAADTAGIDGASLAIVGQASIAAAGSGKLYLEPCKISGLSGLTIGEYFVSKTAGTMALYADITFAANDAVIRVGKAISATEFVFNPEFVFIF